MHKRMDNLSPTLLLLLWANQSSTNGPPYHSHRMCSFSISTWQRNHLMLLKTWKGMSLQTYVELARVTLAQIIIFSRHCAGEVSKMTLESFKKRDQTGLHADMAAGLSLFEEKLAMHFSMVEIMGKRGREVAILLNPEVVSAATLLADKRLM